jgi:hypothetical protein
MCGDRSVGHLLSRHRPVAESRPRGLGQPAMVSCDGLAAGEAGFRTPDTGYRASVPASWRIRDQTAEVLENVSLYPPEIGPRLNVGSIDNPPSLLHLIIAEPPILLS